MLRWLPNALYKPTSERQRFFLEIMFFVFAMHMILFLTMIGLTFFTTKKDQYAISLHQAGATYVLMPLQKHVEQQVKTQSTNTEKNPSRKSQLMNYDTYQEKLKNKTNKKTMVKEQVALKTQADTTKQIKTAAVIPQKTEVSKTQASSAATMRLVDQKVSPAKNHKKKTALKNNPKINPKKTKQQKIKMVEQAVAQDKQQSVVPPERKLVDAPVNVATQQHIVQDEQPTAQPAALNALEQAGAQNSAGELDGGDENLDEVIFIGYEQLDKCVISSKIQHAIQQNWAVPVGAAPGLSCHVKVTISDQGTAKAVVVEKSSNVLVYDNAARRALLQVEYPQEVYNKTISIVLGS